MTSQYAISVSDLGKEYRLGLARGRHDTLIDVIASKAHALFSRDKANDEPLGPATIWALKDINFRVKKGENVGIIGLNGAGKSTLLKVLSRITFPTTGGADINGRLGSLLEVGTGFHPELTGRENIFLYGAVLGMSHADITRKFRSIIEFAELENFIDTPVKRYSSGMYVRLAFSVAAHLEPEILLLDEVLAVGDLPFQRKCIDFAKNLQRRNSTILFVSHNMSSIKNMCQRVIYLRQGQILFDGPTDEGVEYYERDCHLVSELTKHEKDEPPIVVTEIDLLDVNGRKKSVFSHGEPMKLRLMLNINERIEHPNIIVSFVRSDQVACCNYSTELDGLLFDNMEGQGVLELTTPPLKLVSHAYTIYILARRQNFGDLLSSQIGGTFHVKDDIIDDHFGVFHEPGSWTWEPKSV